MSGSTVPDPTEKKSDPGIGKAVFRDLRNADLFGTLEREFRELYRFYLDPETRDRLEKMGRIPRAFWLLGWLSKSLLLKLSPARRILLLLATVMSIMGWTHMTVMGYSISYDLRPWGCLLLLFILMLELKDKLLAKDEIQFARKVQLALMPERQPTIDCWSVWSTSVPANDVGGDLVDYIDLPSERLGIALGDVAGKGLGAALLSAKLQASLRAIGPESTSLDELGTRMNTILNQDGLDNRYATLFYAEVSPGSGHIRYLNAGHNPPFVVRGSDRVEDLPASSFPLGMLPIATYEEGVLDMEPGELLLIYSDGLSEATNSKGEEFSPQRIRNMMPELRNKTVPEAGEFLLSEVRQFLEKERPHDDLSIVLIRREN
ncbi:MAG: PP2C family protein-serine/threonine phosphatase [Acidobacteria bacterium]|uniref:PP2C family protein-serine/threonine phosphatase n=1 Tax=Candidatus Polarisedimenticola svalbardensis TaxID=2886004 RepID=A0A8J7C1P7_9BACT|nr:PP2C family protein-serine/threonine phosphatase [Candidatus Polarisedimenticola svalbardensis]